MSRHPWSSIPAARSSAPVLKIRLFLVLGTLLAAAIAGPLAFVKANSIKIPEVDLAEARPVAAGLAETVARDYVEGRATTVPTAQGVDPTFGHTPPDNDEDPAPRLDLVTFAPAKWTPASIGGRPLEIHQFDLRTRTGDDFTLTVVMLVATNGALLGAQPSLTPAARLPQGLDVPAFDYRDTNVQLGGTSAAAEAAIERWVVAYAADDRQTLNDLVDDPNASAGSYRGLGGWTAADGVEIVSVLPSGDNQIVRVRVVFSNDRANGFTASNEFDLLVSGAATQNPRIVAWGPPGSGPSLTPYINNTDRLAATAPPTGD